MKKLFFVFAVGLLFAGCARSVDKNVADEKLQSAKHKFSVSAVRGDESTRVTFAEGQESSDTRQLVWEDSDKLSIALSSDEFASINEFSITKNNGSSATFDGVLSALPSLGDKAVALYPCDATATVVQSDAGITINTSIAATQDGKALGLMVATGTNTFNGVRLPFGLAAPLLGVELVNSAALQPTLTKLEIMLGDNLSQSWLPIAGDVAIAIDNDGVITTTIDPQGATTICLACNEQLTDKPVAKYIALTPLNAAGGTIRIIATLSDGTKVSKDIDATVLLTGKLYTTTVDIALCEEYNSSIGNPWQGEEVEVTSVAGGLETAVKAVQSNLKKITKLTVTGTIDKRDFDFIRQQLLALRKLDLTGADIVECYIGTVCYYYNWVPNYAFCTDEGESMKGHPTLTEVLFSKSVLSVGVRAFAYCPSLSTVSLPNVTSIGASAFYMCKSLSSVTMPKVTSIGRDIFEHCESLTTLNLSSVTEIGSRGFANCSKLSSITFEKTIYSFGSDVFADTPTATCDLTIPETELCDMETLTWRGYRWKSIERISFPYRIGGSNWARGNLVSDGKGGAKIGAPTDCGLYFRHGSLIGLSGGANGDGTGVATNDVPLKAVAYPSEYTGKDGDVNAWLSNTFETYGSKPYPPYPLAMSYSSAPYHIGKYADNSAESGGIGTGDACRYYLGDEWRLPTMVEYQNLLGVRERITWAYMAQIIPLMTWKENKGFSYNGVEEFCVPLTGLRSGRDATGKIVNVDNTVLLWTSQVGYDGTYLTGGVLWATYIGVGATDKDYLLRKDAAPIRCVRIE